MTTPTITPAPSPAPTRADPANFNVRADAYHSWLVPHVNTELPALITWINGQTTGLDASVTAAAASATQSAASATQAQTFASNAAAISGAVQWVSGTTYAVGAVVWSPLTLLAYRRKIAGAGTTDPSLDLTNWGVITGDVNLTGTQTLTNKTITFANNTLTGVAGTTATQTLTNKTIEAGTFTNGYTEEVATANTGTAYTINLANGTVQYLTLTGNCTYTFPAPVAGKSFILIQRQDGTGGRTVTWPASVDWPGATAPTLTSTANRADKFVFTAIDGSNWLGSNAGQNYTV